MRIMIKGGVWKNSEDEILKAAVMKLGFLLCSFASLPNSARLAGMNGWTRPSRRQNGLEKRTRKLLHSAKLMLTQWRAIAPIVGRTPAQCLERYEKLLDAVGKDESYEAADDPRKLRPGEIDPNPESKPARPDPVDMDEDEKEMLSEARARLANTRGRKAKRKAREKQLEEARRLAALQKRRELKAAGIGSRLRKRRLKGIDYNAEIPFEKRPPPGFFDVSGEERAVEQPKFPTTIEQLEGKRRVDIEAQLRKQDIARNKIAQRRDAPAAIMQVNKLNDPEAVRKRSKLMLPAPQISDRELEEIAKMGYASDILAGDDQTPLRPGMMTPGRTPQRTPAGKGDAIMMEAENLLRLRETQTPLFGGENPELHPSDFSGVTPKKREVQTPNVMATPLKTPGGVGATPMTPRDSSLAKEEKLRQEEMRKNVQASLKTLPAAKFQYNISVPELPAEEAEVAEQMEEDMSDVMARARAAEAAKEAAMLRKRSKVIQRNLPRPPAALVETLRKELQVARDEAQALILKELMTLLEHDNAKYPLDKKTEKSTSLEIEDFEESQLKEAAALIESETKLLREVLGQQDAEDEDYTEARNASMEDMVFFPQKQAYGSLNSANTAEKLDAVQYEFDMVKKRLEADTKKAQKLEQKVTKYTAGYKARSETLRQQIESTFKEVDTLTTELECYRALHQQEQLIAPRRIEAVQEAVKQQEEKERVLQSRYERLLSERDELRLKAGGGVPKTSREWR